MKNKLQDLNDHLFAQLERLGDETLGSEDVKQEIQRGKAIAQVAKNVVELGRLALDAETAREEGVGGNNLSLLEGPRK